MFAAVNPKVDFVALEKEIYSYWEKNGIFEKYLNRNKAKKQYFSFLDGPITANNPMGVHHAWGRTYKDLWQRFKNLQGFKQRFQNGFDCQGLWVEVEVEKELGLRSKKDIENLVPNDRQKSIDKFVQLCRQRVFKYAKIQSDQSKRLGYFMDWDNSYFTLTDENNYMIWHFLKKCHEKGLIYKGNDVVPWCPRCETAISEHEILTEDYKEVTHQSLYLRFPVIGKKNEYLLVWTTTPWTVPANIAVALDAKMEYSQVDFEGSLYWVIKEAVGKIFGKEAKVLKEVLGNKLIGLKYRGAFDSLPVIAAISQEQGFHEVIATDTLIMPISAQEGTGLVHTSTGTGSEDHRLGKKLNLPVAPAINDDASYLEGYGFLSGKNAKNQPELIIDYLKSFENGRYLFKTEKYRHRYPACWRCKKELVWKIAEEWYIKIDPVRPNMKNVAKKINWIPKFGKDRELDWLQNMHDWLISKKNRYWGLALPIYECRNCDRFEVIGSKEELKKRALSGWKEFESHTPHKPWIDLVTIACSKCQKEIKRIDDVGNPWLDAGIVGFSTITRNNQGEPLYKTDKKEWANWFPADFITESFPGQFKNWFYALIAESTVLENIPQFKTVLGFATLLGEDGRPMHKSWGNAIEFNEGADKIGADVMRWMFSKQDPEQNILFGYKKADETRRKFHLVLWNIYIFFVTYANIDKFKPENNYSGKLSNPLDLWLESKLNSTVEIVTQSLNLYDAQRAAVVLEEFVTDMSQWYIRRSRDRVGPFIQGQDKKDFYRTLYGVLTLLSQLLAPFTPFLSEAIFKNLTAQLSVHLSDWPICDLQKINKDLEQQMANARIIVEKGHGLRKEKGIKVRQPLLKLEINAGGDFSKVKNNIWQIVIDELNIKNLIVNEKIKYPQKEVKVSAGLLKKEGQAREIVRKVQIMRKEMGLTITDRIDLMLTSWPEEFTAYIKKETLTENLTSGNKDEIARV